MRLRISMVLVFFLALGASLFAESITVRQLTTRIAGLHHTPDAKAAQQLQSLTLTQRLSATTLQTLMAELPGDQSRRALRVLADTSAFLDPPPGEIPDRPAPTGAERGQILSHVLDFVTQQIPQLPNFLATRVTLHFEETPQDYQQTPTGYVIVPFQPLHLTRSATADVRYVQGREVVEPVVVSAKKSQPPDTGLRTWGIFGPVLVSLWTDITRSPLAFSHWEQSPSGLVAVYHFQVPEAQSHYSIDFCCVEDSEHTHIRDLNTIAGYSGEIAVDPASGAILRLRIEADLKPHGYIERAAILVEYGPVLIGGKAYICPLRSLALSRAHETRYVTAPLEDFGRMNPNPQPAPQLTTLQTGPMQSLLNESLFGDYHVFRASARMLAKGESAPSAPQPASPTVAQATVPSETSATPPSPRAAPTAPPPEPAPTLAAAQPPASASPAAMAPSADTQPEIHILPATRVPDTPALQEDKNNPVPTLHATARLVDVDVVVEDAKGHPVPDLPEQDFTVMDDGHPQTISSFIPPTGVTAATNASATAPASEAVASPREFTNHPSPDAGSHAAVSDTTILMMDPANLAFADLNQARRQALQFLRTLPASGSVGLYILRSASFQPLLEPTTDHAQVASTLAHWIPSAQDLARAQDEENRNRQHIDEVHNNCDLLYVNGNDNMNPADLMPTDGQGKVNLCEGQPVDIQLHNQGAHPARDAILILSEVASHLAEIPGRKQLVWITSDNALADWTRQTTTKEDQGPSFLHSLVLRAQEALNNAHVSLYPLDASQLEPGGINADIQHRVAVMVGHSERDSQTAALGDAAPGMKPGRLTAQLHQDTHPIREEFRDLATATGGRALPRASELARELRSIDDDERGTYRLTFTPADSPDNRFHKIEIQIPGQPRLRLRYRSGYEYAGESTSLRDRFRTAVWQPGDLQEITLRAHASTASGHPALSVSVASPDLTLVQHADRWDDTLDLFLALRSPDATHATLTGEKLDLALRAATRHEILQDGLSVTLPVPAAAANQPLRLIVVDENSGRIGSLTLPAAFEPAPPRP